MPLVALPELILAAQSGQVVSFPTDTLPALAVHPSQASRLFDLKQRSLEKPLILMGARVDDFKPYWRCDRSTLDQWKAVMAEHWPGALTLVLPVHPHLSAGLNPQNPETLGFRIPNCSIALDILQATHPLATTSANRSGEPPLQSMEAIVTHFPEVYALADGSYSPPGSGVASTVAQWTEAGWLILRQGTCRLSQIASSQADR